jgi:hypothetical protein
VPTVDGTGLRVRSWSENEHGKEYGCEYSLH